MSLPFDIYLSSPYLLVQLCNSQQDLMQSNKFEFWAQIVQVNYSTIGYNVGDIIFYKSDPPVSFIYNPINIYPGIIYYLIDENKILFREAVKSPS